MLSRCQHEVIDDSPDAGGFTRQLDRSIVLGCRSRGAGQRHRRSGGGGHIDRARSRNHQGSPAMSSNDTTRKHRRPEAGSQAATPSHEAIARRAYELFLQRGQTDGLALQDWFQAEHELRTALPAAVPRARTPRDSSNRTPPKSARMPLKSSRTPP